MPVDEACFRSIERDSTRTKAGTAWLLGIALQPVRRDQCLIPSPVIDQAVLKPIINEIGMVADYNLKHPIETVYYIPQQCKLPTHRLPIGILHLRAIRHFLRKECL